MSTVMLLSALIGLPLTAISVILVLKYRDRIQLTYIDQGCLSLFESIVKNIDGIGLFYKKKPVDPSLYVLNGNFLNNGNVDIDRSSIHRSVTMKLPRSHQWLQARITESPPEASVNRSIRDKHTLEFDWDLLKRNEFFSFVALIRVPSDSKKKGTDKRLDTKDLLERISFSQRITNLRKINQETVSTVSEQSVRRGRESVMRHSFLVLLGFLIMFYGNAAYPVRKMNFLLEDPDGKVVKVSIAPQESNLLRIEDADKSFLEQITPEELSSKYRLSDIMIVESRAWQGHFFFYAGILYIVIGTGFAILTYIRQRKQNRFMKILKSRYK